METSSIILLLVSASVSFAVGRVGMHFRKRHAQQKTLALQELEQAQAQRDRLAEPDSLNKAKRKRQLLAIHKAARKTDK